MTQLNPASNALAVRTEVPVLRMRLQAAESALKSIVQRIKSRVTEELRLEDSIQHIGIKDGALNIQISPDDGETPDDAARFREDLKALCQGHLEEAGFTDFAEIPMTVEPLPLPEFPANLSPVVTPPISIGFPSTDTFGAK